MSRRHCLAFPLGGEEGGAPGVIRGCAVRDATPHLRVTIYWIILVRAISFEEMNESHTSKIAHVCL